MWRAFCNECEFVEECRNDKDREVHIFNLTDHILLTGHHFLIYESRVGSNLEELDWVYIGSYPPR
jgi:hypothetical protein